MLSAPVIVVVSLLYLGLLFAIASWGDRRADAGRSIIATPYVYALSIAVYCTSWTFFGSVGRAVSSGIGFLPIYLGPTLAFVLGWMVIRKIIRIAKTNHITSIADLIASRYGKSFELGILVSAIAVVGILPYISLQLKAISASFSILVQYPEVKMPGGADTSLLKDTELYVTLAMAAFAILFGTRHIDASERHEGMVAAIAFESIMKLFAFLAVGLFVTFGVFNGFADIFAQASLDERLQRLFTIEGVAGHTSWFTLMLLAMAAIVVLPRQFQVLVVENVDEGHLRQAMWLFPLYLLLINLFVLPITFAGLLRLPATGVDADTFVLTIAMQEGAPVLALLAFIGGLSAASGMIIVETVALATMVSNDLVMPLLLRIGRLHLSERRELKGIILAIRRGTILVVLLLGYLYARTIGGTYALVTIGLVSFVAALQFAPPILAGLYWKGASKSGALAALSGGFATWLYTLLLPSFARSGWLPASFVDDGMFGYALLKPYALLGLDGLDPISHATIWTMLVNISLLIGVSLFTSQSLVERGQAVQFVDVFKSASGGSARVWRGSATKAEVFALLARFLGEARSDAALARYEQEIGRRLDRAAAADSALVGYVERQLAGAIGAASARIMMASVLREEMHDIDEVSRMLDEASQLVVYSRRLEEKSKELETATSDLRIANERLKELDKLKDDFMATVSHEIRTPLTSIRSFSEILRDNPDLDTEQRQEFVTIIVQESERLSRLINDILDLAKMEAGTTDWQIEAQHPKPVLEQALAATSGLFARCPAVKLSIEIAADLPQVRIDRDRLIQVVVNLISNAVKFSDKQNGHIRFRAWAGEGQLRVDVQDNGIGIARTDQARVFERFQQAGNVLTDKPEGTGLGLPITRQILRRFGGEIWLDSEPGRGSVFSFRIPAVATAATQA
jgi:Na+/proline symporter/nitrogen-specific signal transduction histidine kinase